MFFHNSQVACLGIVHAFPPATAHNQLLQLVTVPPAALSFFLAQWSLLLQVCSGA
jgi:hypothetical protein